MTSSKKGLGRAGPRRLPFSNGSRVGGTISPLSVQRRPIQFDTKNPTHDFLFI